MLNAGQRVGPYEIVGPLGAGGMGEVYHARDTRLKRDVALKVLPAVLATDAERLARFEREARVLAVLNHPHIAAIYGFEGGALAMELVEGEALKGPLPLDEALPLARQICEALEYAHERGIVHRDLKPANIKVTPEGSVKLLDFGLAKAMAAESSAADLDNSPTLTHAPTMPGVILGTAAYMAPEQAKGKAVDRRADIWAFGCVLFEMLSGAPAFRGETATEVLAAVIMQEPDWTRLPAATPPAIRALLVRCLKKDPKQRLQAIGDARIVLEEVATAPVRPEAEQAPARHPVRWPWMAAVAVLALAAAAGWLLRPAAPAEPALRFTADAPAGGSFGYGMALSPAGTRLLFVATGSNGQSALWLRPLSSLAATELPGTEGGEFPFWAPDGTAFAFFAGAALKRFDFSTGAVRTICPISSGSPRGGSWSPNGTIVFSPDVTGPLLKVAANGGSPAPATKLGPNQSSDRWPWFLPDGRHFLLDTENSGFSNAHLAVGSLDSTATVNLLALPRRDSAALYSDGFLLYGSGNDLVARKFDATHLRLAGPPQPVVPGIAAMGISGPTGYLAVAAAANGLLAFRGSADATSQLEIVDRRGRLVRAIGPPGEYFTPRVSPDGKRIAVAIANPAHVGESDLWLLDASSGARTRFTFDTADDTGPLWSPDGRWIYYTSNASGSYDVYRKLADGSQPSSLVYGHAGTYLGDDSVSPDGRVLMIDITGNTGGTSIWWQPLAPGPLATPGAIRPYLNDGHRELDGAISPDGRWIAYQSDRNGGGNMEVFVSGFPHHAGQWQVSSGGGYWPEWSADGRELYFISGGHLMAVSVTLGAAPQFSAPQTLFPLRTPEDPTESNSSYSPLAGGRFFINQLVGTQQPPIVLLTHWTQTLTH